MARKSLKKKVLLAIPTFQDPCISGKQDKEGPILRALQSGDFDEVILFGLQVWRLNTFLSEQFIVKNYPEITVKRHVLPIQDLACYKNIFYQLKEKLADYESYLGEVCEEPVFLLPSSVYDYLFDCWLLLSTSLNMKTRICQIESHYSIEGASFSDIDWLNESPKEFRDSQAEPQVSYPCLSKNQLNFLEEIYAKNQNAYVLAEDVRLHRSISQFFFQSTRAKNLNYLKIACSEIPAEISNEILFGYQKEIDSRRILKRNGLLKKLKKGLVTIEGFNALPKPMVKKVEDFISNQKDCRFVNILSDASNLESGIPCFSLPNN